jgi:hypothetical protein
MSKLIGADVAWVNPAEMRHLTKAGNNIGHKTTSVNSRKGKLTNFLSVGAEF